MKYCTICKASAANHWSFCTKCGCYIGNDTGEPETEYQCAKCKTKFFGGMYCPCCGTNVTDAENFLFGKKAIDHNSLKIGMQVSFGTYYFRNLFDKAPIEWIVIAKEPDKILLISKYAIDCQRYHDATGCTWETSEIREYLHTEFAPSAFTKNEYTRIASTVQSNRNGSFCEDKIFLLNSDEFGFLIADSSLVHHNIDFCYPTQYAENRGAKRGGRGTCQWWLRKNCTHKQDATLINRANKREKWIHTNIKAGVRPAIWVKIDSQN